MKTFCLILIIIAAGLFYFSSHSRKNNNPKVPQADQEKEINVIDRNIKEHSIDDISDNTSISNDQEDVAITRDNTPELPLPLKMQKSERPLISKNFLGAGPTLYLTDKIALITGASFDSGPLQTNLEKENSLRYGVGLQLSLSDNLQIAAVYEKANRFAAFEHSYDGGFNMTPKEDFFGIQLQFSF